jgi:hypothetical protein
MDFIDHIFPVKKHLDAPAATGILSPERGNHPGEQQPRGRAGGMKPSTRIREQIRKPISPEAKKRHICPYKAIDCRERTA